MHHRPGDRCATALAAEHPGFLRAQQLDPQRLRERVSGKAALFSPGHDSDFVHRVIVGFAATGGEKEKSDERQ